MERNVNSRSGSYSSNGGPRPNHQSHQSHQSHQNHQNHHVSAYNGKGRPSSTYNGNSTGARTPDQHDELLNYICDTWDRVSREAEGGSKVKYYQCTQEFRDFVPFDLDVLWGRRGSHTAKRQQHNS